MKRERKAGWMRAMALQGVEMLAATSVLVVCSVYTKSGVLYNICMWAALPALGAYTAFRAVGRGLNNYAAWIMPPVMLTAGHYLTTFYLPHGGAMLWTAFCAVAGAAAGCEAGKRRQTK